MPDKGSATAETRLLHELAVEERAVLTAHAALQLAENNFRIAARKYAAVRSLVTDFLGYSPYHQDAVWSVASSRIVPLDQRGRYRFLEMKPRGAIVSGLAELDAAVTLEELDERLKSGGLDLGLRAINAALMRIAGVAKTNEGTYGW